MLLNPTDTLILDAIERRRVLQFHYRGALRLAEPHAAGRVAGRSVLLAYQVGGMSRGAAVPGWRLFEREEMVSIQLTEYPFRLEAERPRVAMPAWESVTSAVRSPQRT